MKNRKSNAMWGVAIVLILGFAYFMNATSWLSKPLFPEAPKQEATGEGPSAAQTMDSLKQAESSRKMAARGEPGAEPEETGLPAEAAIFKKKQETYKPVPNPTSTSSQWWDEDGYVDKQRKETEQQRGF